MYVLNHYTYTNKDYSVSINYKTENDQLTFKTKIFLAGLGTMATSHDSEIINLLILVSCISSL